MVKQKPDVNQISYRRAEPGDAKIASRLLFETFPQKATYIIGLGDADRARRILRDVFARPDHRLSYSVTTAALYQGRMVGLFTAFPGRRLGRLDRRLDRMLLGAYPLRGKIALIARGWPLVFIKEATHKEYFLSNLVVRKRFRGMGLGELMLSQIEKAACQAGINRVALMAAIENTRARRFYMRQGFATEAIHLESNLRVPHLGPGCHRMIKKLDC